MKKFMRLLAAFTVILLVTSCSSGEENLALDADATAKAIIEQVDFKAELVPISKDAVSNWYTLDDSVASYAIYINGSTVPAEEVAVLVGNSAKDLEGLNTILQSRLDSLATQFENYQPGELTKINNPVRASTANVTVMVLTDDPDALAVVDALLDQAR